MRLGTGVYRYAQPHPDLTIDSAACATALPGRRGLGTFRSGRHTGGRQVDRMISRAELLKYLQVFAAVDSIPTSAVRGQRKGTMAAIHGCLGRMHLESLPTDSEGRFRRWLDHRTRSVQRYMPGGQAPGGSPERL